MSERRALIIANSDYKNSSFRGLVSPARDAEELARVLRDPDIGGFDVKTLLDGNAYQVNQEIEDFLHASDVRADHLLLLYFSGHGVTDEEGLLYLAASDTRVVEQRVRAASAVSAQFIDRTMRRSRSRRQVLLLDCCYSGAFAHGKSGPLPPLEGHFDQGKGRIVLTASTGTQLSFEGSGDGKDEPSVYTRILVNGLETGEADRHGDGWIDVDELHDYLVDRLHEEASSQIPTKSGQIEGNPLCIARSKVQRPAELPEEVRETLKASTVIHRMGAVAELKHLLLGDHPGLALAARVELERLRDHDDSIKVRTEAASCLGQAPPPRPIVEVVTPPRPVAPPAPKPGDVRNNARDGQRYVWIPPGTFQMGASPGDTEAYGDEKPPHKVTISKGFWMGQTPVTVGAYQRYAQATGKPMPSEPAIEGRPLNPGWKYLEQPIVNVTWDEAKAFSEWAGMRLPTEAEWEWAARGGTSGPRYGTLDVIAWFADNSGGRPIDSEKLWAKDQANYGKKLRDNDNGPKPVGQKAPNAYNLYDMLGNVWEWVADWYEAEYYAKSDATDPRGPANGTQRVLRGGSWSYYPFCVRASCRGRGEAGFRSEVIGFRCVGEPVKLHFTDQVGRGSSSPKSGAEARSRVSGTRFVEAIPSRT